MTTHVSGVGAVSLRDRIVTTMRKLSRQRELSLVVVLAIVVACAALLQPRFLDVNNFRSILQSAAVVATLSIGQALVVITRNVDLSLGSAVGLCAFAAASLMSQWPDIPLLFFAIGAILLGSLLGAVNGALVVVARVPAIVATLGTLYVFRGITFFLAAGDNIPASELPRSVLSLATTDVLGIPVPVLISLVVLVMIAVAIRELASARNLYAVGDNPDAARIEGIQTRRVVFVAMTASGAIAGLAAILYILRFGAVDARAGTGLEFQTVAAVVVGGVSILGGVGSVTGAFLGAILLATIANALNILDLSPFWLQAITGMSILVAVIIDLRLRRRLDRRPT